MFRRSSGGDRRCAALAVVTAGFVRVLPLEWLSPRQRDGWREQVVVARQAVGTAIDKRWEPLDERWEPLMIVMMMMLDYDNVFRRGNVRSDPIQLHLARRDRLPTRPS